MLRNADRTRQRSQAMPEFALVAPVLFLIIFGIFDLGRGIVDYVAIQHAVNEGGRIASEGFPAGGTTTAFEAPTNSDVITATVSDTTVVNLVQAPSCVNGPTPSLASLSSGKNAVPVGTGWIYITDPEAESTWGSQPALAAVTGNAPGREPAAAPKGCYAVQPASGSEPLQVTIVYHFSPITPLIGNIVGQNITLVAYSVYETEY